MKSSFLRAVFCLWFLLLTAWAQEKEVAFQSAAANAARQRYLAAVADAQGKMVAVLKQVQGDVMKQGQLDEANKVAKVIADPGTAGVEFTSLRAKAAQANCQSAIGRASKQYQAELKAAMAQSMKAGRLDEANQLDQEIKRIEVATAKQADPATGS